MPEVESRHFQLNRGQFPELVRSGINGYIFDPLQPASLAEIFGKCCERNGELSKMGLESQRIVNDYTPEAAAKEILRACVMAMNRRQSSEVVTSS